MTPASMLALTPEDTTSGAGASTDTTTPPSSSSRDLLELPDRERRPFHPAKVAHNTAFLRGLHPDYDRWISHVTSAGECSHPILLRGTGYVVDQATGEIRSRHSTSDMPDEVIYKACGNRRASVCPSCAETYRRDTYQLVLAGLNGGKSVPETVQSHPSAFPTFTAPGFGHVHSRWAKPKDQAKICRPRRKPDLCPHGVDLRCFQRHDTTERCLGQPLCLDCYDHPGQVVWNVMAGELWRRTMEAVKAHLRAWAKKHGTQLRLSFAKVAEMQARGVAHFHALVRLDGVDPDNPDHVVPPIADADFAILNAAIRHAVQVTRFRTPPHPDNPNGWLIEWGEQLDVKPVRLAVDGQVSDGQVAGYLAKYSTKATEAAGHTSARITPDNLTLYTTRDTHVARLIKACWRLGRPGTDPTKPKTTSGSVLDPENTRKNYDRISYRRLRRWAHMLGFGGHFSTKSRKYSTTLRALREARLNWRRQHHRTAEHTTDTETTLVVGHFSYAATGWHTTGDELLARTAAAQAREHRRIAREETEALHLA